MSRRVQFNVRVPEEVAGVLRDEAASLSIGMGELVEILAENYRAGTRSGQWLELDPHLDDALRALAAARNEEPGDVLQGLVAGIVREQLEELVTKLPRTGDVFATPQAKEKTGRPKPVKPKKPKKAAKAAKAAKGDPKQRADEPSKPEKRPPTQPAPSDTKDWGGPDRRKRSRAKQLSDAQRRQLAALPDDLPRTGGELRDWRQKQGLSPRALGELCGVSQVAIGLWEKKDRLSAPILLKLGRGIANAT